MDKAQLRGSPEITRQGPVNPLFTLRLCEDITPTSKRWVFIADQSDLRAVFGTSEILYFMREQLQ